MRSSRYQNGSQFKLEFDPPSPKPLDGKCPKGVVETLADLLLEAVGATMVEGGVDDDQNHA
ncbi:hypothetical protein ABIA00_000389 [Bradyrhizobium ottawaense]|uniref:hypothetical protein n=1 Tax=Bradyrhizobium ottawaense TaxID=931866 RepID=UPI003835049C